MAYPQGENVMSVQMQDIPTKGRLFTCDGCGRSERRQILPDGAQAEFASARFVGWRIAGPLAKPEGAYCPACAGTDNEYWSKAPQESWRVRCTTCDWEWEDDYDEGPLDGKAAYDLAHDHECDPLVEVRAPESDAWRPRHDLNRDGVLTP